VFLDGPHLLLLIYINTTGMMNLKIMIAELIQRLDRAWTTVVRFSGRRSFSLALNVPTGLQSTDIPLEWVPV
jgi:hypothetical protein